MKPVALITGASRGIGAAVARELATAGYDLCLNYRHDRASAEAVAAEVESLGARATIVPADIADPAEVDSLFGALDDHFGRLDALINNAGILFERCSLLAVSPERLDRVMAVNVRGTVLCCQAAVRRMSTAQGGEGGAIVNVSSAASRLGSAFEYVDYAMSKGAIDTLTIGLANEVAAEGIRVNAVRPGLIYTDIHADGGLPDRVDRLKDKVPMQRGGEAIEVARAITWLVSDASSYTTGSFVDVSGGR